ncbi:hypothetical protein DH2020_030207 [Rehmannia glutinosa]|uniref:Nucleolar complex protein 2-like protein n=1 Tax=Rehmannia glutinosa TaxID=99300 RepID=A0ABR0VLH8_REHGL
MEQVSKGFNSQCCNSQSYELKLRKQGAQIAKGTKAMGKLGKKARKFAKKHLQSVLRNRRKTKVLYKKRARKDGPNDTEEQVDNPLGLSNGSTLNLAMLLIVFLPLIGMTLKIAHCTLLSFSFYEIATTTYSAQNKKIHADLAIQKKKLDRLRKKYSDEGDSSDQEEQGEDNLDKDKRKPLTNSVINTWCQMVKEDHNQSALISLLNAYHAACHYGTESIGHRIENSETFCNILLFTLSNADDVTDSDILAFAMTRLRASLIFFVAFPSLIHRLIKAAVHLWATGGGVLSSASFLVTRDVAAIATEITDIKHMQFLRDCIVELCSLDVQKSSIKAVASMSQLSKILSWGLQTKKKEAVRKICSWEYVNCIDVWVRFISANIRGYDLQSLFFLTTQLVNGLAHMFPGPRYFPLRLKCIEWLNYLANSSGNFIPVTSLVLDILEYKVAKEEEMLVNAFNIASILKMPKHYLKSKSFQDECFHSAVEQLSLHFAQWSHHISFPDLATVPLIRLRKIHEITTLESLRRMVKRFIDQVEQNVDFVQKKRDEVSFSPHDHQSVDSFLQLEKSSLNAPFSQYYRSVLEKAAERNLHKTEKISLPEKRNLKRNRAEPKRKPVAAGLHVDEKEDHQNGVMLENGIMDNKRRKRHVEAQQLP